MRAALLAFALVSAVPSVAATPTIPDLVQTTDISGLALSPDGRLLAFRTERASIERNSYDITWHVVDLATGEVRTIGGGGGPIWSDLGDLVTETPIWSPDSRTLYFRALAGKAVEIWSAQGDGSGSRTLVHDAADVVNIALATGGKTLTYEVGATRDAIRTAEMREFDAGILVDASVDPAQNMFRGAIINGRHATQRLTGNWFARTGLLADAPHRRKAIDLVRLDTRDDAPEPAQPAMSRMLADGRLASIAARSDRGETALLSVNANAATLLVSDGAKSVTCDAAPCRDPHIVAMAWRPAHDQLLFTTADAAHAETLHVWDLATGTVRDVAHGAGKLSGDRSPSSPCAVSTLAAYCVTASAASPPRLERIDLDSGGRSVLFDPNATIRQSEKVTVELLHWADAKGQPFTGKLFLPASPPDRLPLFINYYRCEGFLRGGVGDEWPFAPLAAAGIAALCIDVPRASDDALDNYRLALRSVRAAVDALDARGIIDRARVGMGGLSFGSETAMWVATHSDLLAAVSIASVQLEPGYYWFNGVRGRDNHANLAKVWGLGSPEETPARWKLLSSALNIDRIKAPVLLQLPEQEARWTMELYAKLTESTTPAELYAFADEPHLKILPRHKLAAYTRNLDWFRYWLQGYIDPDPAKAAQYRRWTALRDRWKAAQAPQERSQSSRLAQSKMRK